MKRVVVTSLLAVLATACSKAPERTASASNTPLPVQPKEAAPTPQPEPSQPVTEPAKDPEMGQSAATAPAAVQKLTGQGYELELSAPDSAAAGAKAVVKLVLRPTGGYHLNKEFPTALKVKPPAGVNVAKAEQGIADATQFGEKQATFEVSFTSDAGAKQFEATFKFAVCTATTCDPKREKLAWKVDVK